MPPRERAGWTSGHGRPSSRYVLRPPLAQERVTLGPEGLVRTDLKRAFADGTVAIDFDPRSLLCRFAASVPAPGTHPVRYAAELAGASSLRSRTAPKAEVAAAEDASEAKSKRQGCRYRSWAAAGHPRHRCVRVPDVPATDAHLGGLLYAASPRLPL